MAETQTIDKEQSSPNIFPLKAILGQKVGMTHIFTEGGQFVPVTVIYTGGCTSTGVRTPEKDGYHAVQLGMGEVKEKNQTKPALEHFKKLNLKPKRWLKEFRVPDASKFQVGLAVSPEVFTPGDFVDVSGISKGKGFAGVMKRHNFSGLPASHGASDKERSPGSSGGGSGQPQRVLKGHHMAGRLGSEWITIQKMEVVKIDKENDLILVRGAIPGTAQGLIIVQETVKHIKHRRAAIVTHKSTKKAANVKKEAPKAAAAAAPAKK